MAEQNQEQENKFLKWIAALLATIIAGVIVYYLTEGKGDLGKIFKKNPVEQSYLYSKLKYFLEKGQWKQADIETYKIMIDVAGRSTTLDSQSISNFSCTHLKSIDNLWSKYSNQKFGFAVQKSIWEDSGKNWNSFIASVDWESPNDSLYNYSLSAAKGHLPATFCCYSKNRDYWFSIFVERATKCGL